MAIVDQQQNSNNDDWTDDVTNPGDGEGKTPDQGKKDGVPEDHPTKLGRKVKEMGEQVAKIGSLEEKLNQLLALQQEAIANAQRAPQRSQEPKSDDDDVPEHIKEVLPYVERQQLKREQQKEQANWEYSTKYAETVRKANPELDEELHKAVIDELLETNYRSYKKTNGDPVYDAQVNIDRAVANILRKQRKGNATKPNVRGDKNNAPLGLSSGSMNTVQEPTMIVPDQFAAKFLKALGAKEDEKWVQESLKSAK